MFDVAMGRNETMRPKGYAALIQSRLYLRRWSLKDGGASNRHLEFAIDTSQTCEHSLPNFADQLYREAACLSFRWNAVFGKAGGSQFARQRRRTCAIANDLDFFFLHMDVLKVSIARKRLHRIKIEPFSFDNFPQPQVEANGTFVDDGRFRRRTEQLRQTGTERRDLFPRDRFRGADQFGGVTGVDVDAEHAHPLRRVGHATGLTHTSAAKGPNGGKIQPILKAGGARISCDLVNGERIVGGTIDELVGNTNFQRTTAHHQTAHRAPSLRAGMSPEQHPFPRGREIAYRTHQVR